MDPDGRYTRALPHALRPEIFEAIRVRLDRPSRAGLGGLTLSLKPGLNAGRPGGPFFYACAVLFGVRPAMIGLSRFGRAPTLRRRAA